MAISMHADRARELGIDPSSVEDGLARNLTFPARWYWDRRIFDLELDEIFPRSWVFAAPLRRLERAGDIVATRAGHIPIVLTRDLDGELHGFVNVCRHRAYPVAEADGNKRMLQCGYHAWTYELDGRLRKAPGCELESTFDMGEFALEPVAVDTWNGFVFVNPDRSAVPLTETFPALGTLAERGLDFSGFTFHEISTYDVAANWKIGVENACECYHCPTIHSGSFGNAFEVGPEDYEYVNRGPMLCQFTDYNVASSRFHHEPRDGDRGFRFAYLWPLTFLAQDDDVAFTHVIVPTAPDRFTNIYEMYAAPGLSQNEIDEWMAMYGMTLQEDARAMEAQQPGLRSNMIPHGRLMPSRESAISAFHRQVWTAMAEVLEITPAQA
jgi:phenylpropionate dioxygenase-like ring-hydroxylating dioxygenase large terminal subunit